MDKEYRICPVCKTKFRGRKCPKCEWTDEPFTAHEQFTKGDEGGTGD